MNTSTDNVDSKTKTSGKKPARQQQLPFMPSGMTSPISADASM